MVKKLKVNQGTDEVNFEGVRYRVDNDGLVTVPDAAVEPLLKTGGLTLVEDAAPEHGTTLDEGTARMVSIGEPVGGVSWQGQSFQADAEGVIVVPHAAVADLVAHGLIVEPPPVKVERPDPEAEARAAAILKKQADDKAAADKKAEDEAKAAADKKKADDQKAADQAAAVEAKANAAVANAAATSAASDKK